LERQGKEKKKRKKPPPTRKQRGKRVKGGREDTKGHRKFYHVGRAPSSKKNKREA